MDRQWFTAQELSGLPAMPGTSRGVNIWGEKGLIQRRKRQKGKGWEYALESLPTDTRAALVLRYGDPTPTAASEDTPPQRTKATYEPQTLWRAYEQASPAAREAAEYRVQLLCEVERVIEATGYGRRKALALVAERHGESPATLRGWWYGANRRPGAKDYHRADWLAALLPQWGKAAGRRAACSEAAWERFKALYLTRKQRTIAHCHSDIAELAEQEGWDWPPLRTVQHWVLEHIPRELRVFMREGPEAYDRLIPPLKRDRSGFHALEAVNGDGKQFAIWCRFENGEVAKPKVWFWQDLLSNYMLAFRADVSENKDLVRLAYGDLVERWGIPKHVFIDNTTAVTSKWLTGRVENRYRYPIRDDDPVGLFPALGTDVRFVRPGRGQSKPIERAFQDLMELVDKHEEWDQRGTKARPIPIEEFLKVLGDQVQRYNARTGRRTDVAQGRSFEAVFFESYERAPIRRVTAEQRRLCLLAAERVRAHRDSGMVVLGRGPQGENRYWCQELASHAGEELVVRFDPRRLHESVHAYTLDGRYIGEAACGWRGGFMDTETARDHHRAKGRSKRFARKLKEAEVAMSAATVAKELPRPERPDPPERQVVEGKFRKASGSDVAERALAEETPEEERRNDDYNAVISQIWEKKKRDLI